MGDFIDKIKQKAKDSYNDDGRPKTYDSVFQNHDYGFAVNLSVIRDNREYMTSTQIDSDLNTYLNFDPFWTFGDLYAIPDDVVNKDTGEVNKEALGKKKLSSSKGVRSIFNKLASVAFGAGEDVNTHKPSVWRLSNNVPLLDSPATRSQLKKFDDCSVKALVEASAKGWLGKETYNYSDFMYCKYLGRIPNNYMVTLRRFPTPVDDFILQIGVDDATFTDKEVGENGNPNCIGCMVTWMGTPGNDMSNILKYLVSMPYKELQSQWHQSNSGADTGKGKVFSEIAAAFDPTYRKQAASGKAPLPFGNYVDKFLGGKGDTGNPYNVSDFSNFVDSNKTYGPVDAIKSTYMRDGDAGIKFQYGMTLVFDYELKSYNGINGRQAMLDLIANILAVTYTTGVFWAGGYRGGGAHQNNLFTKLKIFQCNGGFNEFVDAFAQDYTTITNKVKSDLGFKGDNWLEGTLNALKSALNQIGGMLMGGLLNKLGRPQKSMANSLLSDAPVGLWHVTIGNPFRPIVSIGNMILKNTTIEHYGPLGIDDFPTGLRITCELDRGKPRDLRGIENLYMHGNDRIYTPMGPKVFDMYRNSKEYRSAEKIRSAEYKEAFVNYTMANEYSKLFNAEFDGVNIYEEVAANVYESTDDKYRKKMNLPTKWNDWASLAENFNANGMPKTYVVAPKYRDRIKELEKKAKEYGEALYDTHATEMAEYAAAPSDTQLSKLKVKPEDMKMYSGVLKKYFGTKDSFSVYVAACEQEYGASRKPKEPKKPK